MADYRCRREGNITRGAVMKTKYFTILMILFMLAYSGNMAMAAEVINPKVFIDSPDKLAQWMSSEFTYVMKFPDTSQLVNETLKIKSGDCEDFAVLASFFLDKMGIENEVYVVAYRDLGVQHAVCVWKNSDGCISFISNTKIYHTSQRDISASMKYVYPDCESITVYK